MRTKIYVAYGKQSRLNRLKNYIEVKINRLNYKILNFVKFAQRKWKGNTYMGLLTESGLMKVADFKKVSFDQFVEDWEKKFMKYPEESIYGDLTLPERKQATQQDMTLFAQQIFQFDQEIQKLSLLESDVRLKKDGCCLYLSEVV